MTPVVLRGEAQAEFDEAFDWYEAQQPGLGVAFIEQIQVVLDAIADNPSLYPIVFEDIRKVVVRRFPYCVFYRSHPDCVEIIAVFHAKRDPAIWRGRS